MFFWWRIRGGREASMGFWFCWDLYNIIFSLKRQYKSDLANEIRTAYTPDVIHARC